MKKNILTIIAASVSLLPLIALATYQVPPEPGQSTSSVTSLVTNVMTAVWIAFSAIVIVLFIWAGVKFLTAAGSPEKIQEARQAALWGVVGVVVVVLAYSIFEIAKSLIASGT